MLTACSPDQNLGSILRQKDTDATHSLSLPFVRNVEHIFADVHPKPDVAGFFQRFAAQAAPTPHIENEARFPWLRSVQGVGVISARRGVRAHVRTGVGPGRSRVADTISCSAERKKPTKPP